MSKTFNADGIEKIAIANLPSSIGISNLTDLSNLVAGKINLRNQDDGLLYTLCVQNIAGVATLYPFKGGSARMVNGEWYINNDDDGLWYPLRSELISGRAVIYLGTGITLA